MRDGHAKWSSCSHWRRRKEGRKEGRKRGIQSDDEDSSAATEDAREARVTQPRPAFADTLRSTFHPSDDDLTRKKGASLSLYRRTDTVASSNFARMGAIPKSRCHHLSAANGHVSRDQDSRARNGLGITLKSSSFNSIGDDG